MHQQKELKIKTKKLVTDELEKVCEYIPKQDILILILKHKVEKKIL